MSRRDVSSSQRPKRMTQTSTRLSGYEVYTDDPVTDEGNLVHYALFVDVEPVNHEQALKEKVWKDEKIEEMTATKRNKTLKLMPLPPGKRAIGVK